MEGRIDLSVLNTAERLGLAQLYSQRVAPTSSWSDMGRADHFVQFYESDDFIVNAAAEYIIHGLRSGETCIAAATTEHLAEIERIIHSFTNGLEAAREGGRYIPLNAVEALSSFMAGDLPDEEAFSSNVGEIVAKAAAHGRPVRVFGEMVGVLCTEDNYRAAVRLEGLWNGLRRKYQFSLFCAYPMACLMHDAAGEYMMRICNCHTRVIPNESYTSLTSADERLKAIAVLQQRSKQLEAEVAELESRIALRQAGLQPA